MRTKALLAAAVLAAGIATSMAQSNVYSVNVVGYVNQVCPANGFTMIANPLNTTNNTTPFVIQNPRNNMIVYKWVLGVGFVGNNYSGSWSSPAQTLNPGEGAFLYVPAGIDYTNTWVGEVKQGSLTNVLNTGFTMVGSQVPQAGLVQTDLAFPVSNNSIVYKWVTGVGFVGYNYSGAWAPSEPTVNVAEGVFAFKPVGTDWVRNFTVQ
jgi:hypothetical protein